MTRALHGPVLDCENASKAVIVLLLLGLVSHVVTADYFAAASFRHYWHCRRSRSFWRATLQDRQTYVVPIGPLRCPRDGHVSNSAIAMACKQRAVIITCQAPGGATTMTVFRIQFLAVISPVPLLFSVTSCSASGGLASRAGGCALRVVTLSGTSSMQQWPQAACLHYNGIYGLDPQCDHGFMT